MRGSGDRPWQWCVFCALAVVGPAFRAGPVMAAEPAGAPPPVTSKWSATIYGFVELDTIHDSLQGPNDLMGNAALPRAGTYAATHDQTNFVRNSRLGLRVGAPDLGSLRASAVLEMDFFGNQPAGISEAAFFNNPTFRIRHAYFKLETPVVDVVVGQTWELFGWQAMFNPASVNLQGLPAQIYSRTAQVRLSRRFALASDRGSSSPSPRSGLPSGPAVLPDGQAGLKIDFPGRKAWRTPGGAVSSLDSMAIGVSGVVRRFAVPSFVPNPTTDVTTTGWGVSADVLLPIIPAASATQHDNALTLGGSLRHRRGNLGPVHRPRRSAVPGARQPAAPHSSTGVHGEHRQRAGRLRPRRCPAGRRVAVLPAEPAVLAAGRQRSVAGRNLRRSPVLERDRAGAGGEERDGARGVRERSAVLGRGAAGPRRAASSPGCGRASATPLPGPRWIDGSSCRPGTSSDDAHPPPSGCAPEGCTPRSSRREGSGTRTAETVHSRRGGPGGHWKRFTGRHKLRNVRKSPPRVPVARDGASRQAVASASRPSPQHRTRSRGPTPRRCGVSMGPAPRGASRGMRRDMTTVAQGSWVERIAKLQDSKQYAELHWEGSLRGLPRDLVRKNPRVTRTAFQRIYDMILSHGKTEYIDNKKKLIRYHFFSDERFGGRDAIFGLDVPLMKLVNVFKSAAQRLRHREARHPAPRPGRLVASRTIARLLKKGLEEYSQDPRGRALHLRLEHREEGRRRHAAQASG